MIDDSYNANSASTATALATTRRGRGRIAALGCLAEFGERERAAHEEVGRLAAQLGTDRVVVVGGATGPIHDGAVAVSDRGGEPVLVTDQEAAVARLRTELCPGDVVLANGSRYRTWAADALRDQLVVLP